MMNKETSKGLEKELIWEQTPDSGIYDPCNTKPIHNAHVHIHIPAKGLQLEALFQAEKLLRQAGLSFDTGYGCGGRDWEWDWSLKGAYVKLRKTLTEQEQLENFFYRNLFDGYSMIENDEPNPDYLSCTILGREEYSEIYIAVHGKREKFETTAIRKLLRLGCEEVDLSPIPEANPEVDPNDPAFDPKISNCIFRYGENSVHLTFDGDDRY